MKPPEHRDVAHVGEAGGAHQRAHAARARIAANRRRNVAIRVGIACSTQPSVEPTIVEIAQIDARGPRGLPDDRNRASTAGRPAAAHDGSRRARRQIGHVAQAVAGRHDIERRRWRPAARHVADQPRDPRGASGFARASSIIRGVRSSPTTGAPRARRCERDVAGAARQIQHARARRDARRARSAAPSSADRARTTSSARDEVVAVGDRREQPAHVPALRRRACRTRGRDGVRSVSRPMTCMIMSPMLPSQTVENYLKTIYLAQAADRRRHDLVPMGQLASALGVVPGTATTMVKSAGRVGTRALRAVHGRAADAGRREAGEPRAAAPSAHRAVPREGARHELGRGARRSRTARARRVRAADRSHRRDARPARRSIRTATRSRPPRAASPRPDDVDLLDRADRDAAAS